MDSDSASTVLTCTFGWGQVFRLYHDCAYIDGKYYALRDLTGVYPTYRRVVGIASATLELQFGHKRLVLRGIAAVDMTRRIVMYLLQWCRASTVTVADVDQQYLVQSAHATRVLPVVHFVQTNRPEEEAEDPYSAPTFRVSSLDAQTGIVPGLPARSTKDASNSLELLEDLSLHRAVTMPVRTVKAVNVPPEGNSRKSIYRLQEPSASSSVPGYVQVRTRSMQENGRKERVAPLRSLRKKTLPAIPVPIHLLPGEHAYYTANATLCGERGGEAARSPYPVQDQGMLILTDRRIIYIGRRSQIVLDYAHLLHVSRLRRAIAFQTDRWQKRVIFEVARPADCVRYVEKILARRPAAGTQDEPDDPTVTTLPIITNGTGALRRISAHTQPYKGLVEMADIDTIPLRNAE